MTSDEEALNSLVTAVSKKLSSEFNSEMETNLKSFKDSLQVMDSLLKRQEAAETRAEQRMVNFEKQISEKHDNLERSNNERFTGIENRLVELETTIHQS